MEIRVVLDYNKTCGLLKKLDSSHKTEIKFDFLERVVHFGNKSTEMTEDIEGQYPNELTYHPTKKFVDSLKAHILPEHKGLNKENGVVIFIRDNEMYSGVSFGVGLELDNGWTAYYNVSTSDFDNSNVSSG